MIENPFAGVREMLVYASDERIASEPDRMKVGGTFADGMGWIVLRIERDENDTPDRRNHVSVGPPAA